MKGLLYLASVLVLSVGVTLFLLPGRTDTLFSWTVNPPLTAAFLGAAYLAAFVLELLGARETLWARARVAVPAVLTFTVLTLIATLFHIDKFHFGPGFSSFTQAGTWVWLLVYALVPVAMIVVLAQQLRRPGIDPPREVPMPGWIRTVLFLQAVVGVGLGTALFIAPAWAAERFWSWPLTALTGRAVGAWLIGLGIAAGHMAWENDWLRARAGAISFSAFGLLQLAALLRFGLPGSPAYDLPVVEWSDWQAWAYVLLLLSVFAVGAYGWLASAHPARTAR
jgi:hypothetical protein